MYRGTIKWQSSFEGESSVDSFSAEAKTFDQLLDALAQYAGKNDLVYLLVEKLS